MIVTDAWRPQINGVVRTLESTSSHLQSEGHHVHMVTPQGMKSIPCPTYKEISLTWSPLKVVEQNFDRFAPEAIHIATEGPLGWAARQFCKKHGFKFTTSFHTQFPEYIYARTGLPVRWSYRILKRFHSLARRVMVNTQSMEKKLSDQGFQNLSSWSRGVDTALFRPVPRTFSSSQPKLLYVGRVAVEKNLEDFLDMKVDAVKIVVGDGPQRPSLEQRYPDVLFVGPKFGDELVHYYSMADAFVFPSRTDTFGLVMLEALACGTPVAAYPVEGPVDVIQSTEVGSLDHNLKKAVLQALRKSRKKCREYACQFSWARCTQQFLSHLVNI
jgi:glycosyltransferase involved in cell wall biosynthesis